MILGINKPPEEWSMTPGVKTYDGLIQTIQNAGYTLGSNFFVFNYDWRKPVDEIANDLKNFIDRHPPPAETKIDLIGHSLGGLVVRAYVQKNPQNGIDQLITIGSPHKGAVKSYYLWEGGELSKGLSGWQRIAAGFLLQLQKRNFENNVEALRKTVPSIRDILPTFPYLKSGGAEKPLATMKQRNNYFETLNQPPLPNSLTSILNTLIGLKEKSTLRWINIQERNTLDQVLGKWEDGKPLSEEKSTGDDTVLDFSASLDRAGKVIELTDLNHGELVETVNGQETIMNLLGLSPSAIVPAPKISYEPSLVFGIASPANISVFDPNNNPVAENQKFVFVPQPIVGNYRVEVSQEGSGGHYHLVMGNINQNGDIWMEEEGETDKDKPQTHIFTYTLNPNQNKMTLLIFAREKLEKAKIKAESLKKPLKNLLLKAIDARIKETGKIIFLLQSGKIKQADIKIREAILSISNLEKNLKIWGKIYKLTPEDQEEFMILFRQAKDYLLQAAELK